MSADASELPFEGRLRPPMANGEVLFEAPWQGRVFGMAVALRDAGVFAWSEFQAHLIVVIGDWDATHPDGSPDYAYYEHFQEALGRLLTERGLVDPGALEDRICAYAARPHGHDHDHGHDHQAH